MNKKTKLLVGLGAVAAAWGGASYAAVRKSYGITFSRTSLPKYSADRNFAEHQERYPGKYTRKSVRFPSGDVMLQGYIYGENNDKGLIIFSHGVFAGHESYVSGILNMVDRGYRVFGFDNTGCCESEGDTSKGLPQGPLDLAAALNYVECDPELSKLPRFLFGHSWGGYSVCAVLNLNQRVDGIVSIAGFTEPVQVTAEMGAGMFGPVAYLTRPMIRLENRRLFKENAGLSAIEGINRTEIPILIMHGVGDHYVRVDGAGLINHQDEITNPNVTFFPLDYEGRNGHNDIFLSKEAKECIDELEERLAAPKAEHHVKETWELPDEVKAEYYKDLDKDVSAGINLELFDTVDEFYSGILDR